MNTELTITERTDALVQQLQCRHIATAYTLPMGLSTTELQQLTGLMQTAEHLLQTDSCTPQVAEYLQALCHTLMGRLMGMNRNLTELQIESVQAQIANLS